MFRRLAVRVFLPFVAIAITACGSSRPTPPASPAPTKLSPAKAVKVLAAPTTENRPIVTHDVVVPQQLACPPGHGYMGCSAQPQALSAGAAEIQHGGAPNGAKFPDVSDWQGHPNWQAAKQWGIYGAVAKLGEYSLDADVQYNVGQFRSLGLRWSVYLFVRPQGCSTETSLALSWLKQIGGPSSSGPVLVLDEEEPGLSGYATCIDAGIYKAYHRHVVVYTAPGTWSGGSGGSIPVWIAAYGPSSPPSCPWGCQVIAWQFTDGHFGFPTTVPGIGTDDVNVTYKFFSYSHAPNPPKPSGPRCFSSGWQHTSFCNKIRSQDAALGKLIAKEKGYLGVSNANKIKLEHELAVVTGRIGVEQSKVSAAQKTLDASLAKYGYHKH